MSLVDARHLESGKVLISDVCIIGGGPAGIAIADRLRGSGLTVLLLEGGGLSYEISSQALYSGRSVGSRYFRLDACRWRLFGGGSNRWGGWCRPLDPRDFHTKEWLPLSGWPIGPEALRPYESDAAALLQLPNACFDLPSWSGHMSPALALPDSDFESIVFQHSPGTNFAERYGQRLEQAPNITVILHANVTVLTLDREVPRIRELQFGTLDGRRFTVRSTVFVLAAGGIENPRLMLASRHENPVGVGNESGWVGRCFMEHFHLPLGHLLTTNAGLDNGFFRKRVLPNVSLRGLISPTVAASERNQLLATTISLEGASFFLGTPYVGWPPRLMWAPLRIRRRLRQLGLNRLPNGLVKMADKSFSIASKVRSWRYARAALIRNTSGTPSARVYSLYFRSEQAPDPRNRVVLDDECDALGMPRSRLEWRPQPRDIASLSKCLRLFKDNMERLRIGNVICPDDAWSEGIVGGPHHMGTTRMSVEPRLGVVNDQCRVHSVDNLYVAGSSVFPTSGYANPTFTIVCLALRLADSLRARLQA